VFACACLLWLASQAGAKPVMADFTTCAQLGPNLYPADTTTWFDPSKNPQVVLYAHMLFPLLPGQDDLAQAPAPEAWHPPMTVRLSPPLSLALNDSHFAFARWVDPDGAVVAEYGLTMPARVSSDYVRLQGRQYIPHTFAMSIGTKDIRLEAGQKAMPSKAGQYHIRLYVDGEIEGIAFFKMLNGVAPMAPQSKTSSAPVGETLDAEESGLNGLRALYQALTKTGK
jgi:hypothetical protein